MNIGNIGSVVNTYNFNKTKNKEVELGGDFSEKLQGAQNAKKAENRAISSKWDGDIIQTLSDKLDGISYGRNVEKNKSEMTIDEYKQWFMNETASYPVSGWVKSTFSSSTLVIKEDAFERMKDDPEYEQYVMNRIKSFYSASGLFAGGNNVSYEVIGGSPEECYGYAGPVGGNGFDSFSDKEKTWWEKRHKELEEILKEQNKRTAARADYERKRQIEAIEIRKAYTEFLYNASVNSNGLSEFSDMFSLPVSAKVSELMATYEAGTIAQGNVL